jgi:predicted extracellular nuclease
MKPRLILCFLVLLLSAVTFAQGNFRVMFYNVENLFDTEDDPHKNDNEFLPDGAKHWTEWRYRNKLNNIATVISTAGEGWETPDAVGLCEVENEHVMDDLTRRSPLKKWNYRYVITDSPDKRGIDVALMYRPDRFKYLTHTSYRIKFPGNNRKRTRDVLHVTGLVAGVDTLDVFVCHSPSRVGGEKESEPSRIYVASVIKSNIDLLQRTRKNAKIIVMGDFNDEPSNNSVLKTLGAAPVAKTAEPNRLYNLFYHYETLTNRGSYKYRRTWNMLDQIIVSGNLLDKRQPLHVLPETAQIFSRDYMMTGDKSRGGIRPKKTFHGSTYEGGYSDHLPIIVDFRTGRQ